MAARNVESQVIQKLRLTIVDGIATSAGPLWLSQKLQQEDFMSTERASGILNTMGFSSSDKVSQMMEAVESKIKRDPSDPSEFFEKFVAIVESEPALGDVYKALDDCYQNKLSNDKDLEAQPLLRARVQDEDDDTDLDKNPEGQKLLPRRVGRDGDGESDQRHKADGIVKFQKSIDKGQSCKHCTCCVCCTTVAAVAVMTIAFVALNHSAFDSGIGISRRDKRSMGYPQQGKAPSTLAVVNFLWQISPTILMFAFAITTYCTRARTFLKQTPWFHFYNVMAVCFYGVAMLLLAWKPLKHGFVTGHLMPLGAAVNGVLVGFCTMQSSFIFVTTAVFVHPGKTFWEVIAIVALITGGAIGVLAFIGGIYAMYMADWDNTQYQHGSLDSDFQFFIPEIVGNNLAAIVGLYFMFQALSLSRIATLTEAKRYVLFFIIVLLYMGYCIYGISEGLVTGATVVICAVVSVTYSLPFKLSDR